MTWMKWMTPFCLIVSGMAGSRHTYNSYIHNDGHDYDWHRPDFKLRPPVQNSEDSEANWEMIYRVLHYGRRTSCTTAQGDQGVCRPLNICPYVLDEYPDIVPVTCYWKGRLPVVCCPPLAKTPDFRRPSPVTPAKGGLPGTDLEDRSRPNKTIDPEDGLEVPKLPDPLIKEDAEIDLSTLDDVPDDGPQSEDQSAKNIVGRAIERSRAQLSSNSAPGFARHLDETVPHNLNSNTSLVINASTNNGGLAITPPSPLLDPLEKEYTVTKLLELLGPDQDISTPAKLETSTLGSVENIPPASHELSSDSVVVKDCTKTAKPEEAVIRSNESQGEQVGLDTINGTTRGANRPTRSPTIPRPDTAIADTVSTQDDPLLREESVVDVVQSALSSGKFLNEDLNLSVINPNLLSRLQEFREKRSTASH